MFQKILIANRGEIAVRIIRACKELDLPTVAVYSQADREALHVQLADEAVCVGPSPATESYLNMQNILSAAILTKAQAIHPGFGFLAENDLFAAMCRDCNIVFIGPSPETIRLMGNKANARALMMEHGVPVIPGSGVLADLDEAKTTAARLGYPVMIKASAGGGGKGIRVVRSPEELSHAFDAAGQEALASFGNGDLYLEKLVEKARHIEVQILGDAYGNLIHLGERDCSLQRRNQKVLEECPSVALTPTEQAALGEAAVKAGRAADYQNAGTIEFLYGGGKFYFMEMNTRIQVEHPVTELVTGVDIVKEQIRIAQGEKLSLTQEDVSFQGHAIECRINAECPARNFAPTPGTLKEVYLPGGPGVRVDSAVYSGCTVPPYYDSMLAKIITYGHDRAEAIARMKRALEETVLLGRGVENNIDFLLEILAHEKYLAGEFDTAFITEELL